MATKSDSMTIRGKLVYKDKSPIAGARVRIWETDPLQKKNRDDLIVDDTTGPDGHFSGTGVWKDSGLIDKPTYRYEVTLDGRTETGRNVLSAGFFESFGLPWESPRQAAEDRAEGSIHIAGTVVFNDGSPMSGAQVRIWETDPLPNNPDDLIVDTRTDDRGRFEGAGFWKDGGIELAATYRYEVTYEGEVKKGANITNPLDFFAKLNTNILSEEEKSIRLSGRVVFKNGAPIAGARIQIWESDPFKNGGADDLIVNALTDADGRFTGEGVWRDGGNKVQIGTYRYQVDFDGDRETGANILNPRAFFAVVKTPWEQQLFWNNWIHDYDTRVDYHYPRSRHELKACVEDALRRKKKVKVVGSGHSHSEVAVPDDGALLIDLRNLSGGLAPYPWLRPSNDIDGAHLQRVGAGTQIRQINREVLVPKRLGLINQGPFDGQTIAGAINTNTHGSGLAMGGFADMVESMEMVVVRPRASGEVDAEIWVIEPRDGISDPATFAPLAEDRMLVQDDDLFHSAVCGYGLFGVAVSYTLRVRDLYWLNEHYQPCTWKDIREVFADGGVPPLLRANQHVKIYVNTAEWRNERPGAPAAAIKCRIDTWNETPLPLPEKPANWEKGALHPIFPPMRPRLDGLTKDLAGTTYDVRGSGSFTAQALNLAFFKERKQPAFYREDDILELVRQPHQDAYRNASVYYRALRRTRDSDIKYDPSLAGDKLDNTVLDGDAEPEDFGPSIEVAVPIDRMVETVECMLDLVAEQDVNFAIPTGIRFTKASQHHLCPTQGRDSAFIELVGFLPDNNGKEPSNHDWHEYRSIYKQAFNRLFHRLREQIPEVRFHLGKCNDYGAAELQADFPKFDTWRERYRLFNWTAIFDCPNARRWKLDKDVPALSAAAVARRMDALTSPGTGRP